MKNYPLLTICLLAHNGEKFISKTLDSIFNQTYPNLEIIVSDNYSDDKTAEIVKTFLKDKKNVFYRKNEKPLIKDYDYIGCYSNYNSCINSGLIKGEFVSFCHDDDIYERNIFQKEIDFLISHPEIGAVFTTGNIISEKDEIIGKIALPKSLRGKNIYSFIEVFKSFLNNGNTFLITPTFTTRKDILDNVGLFNEKEFRTCADLDMWLRILEKYPIGILNENLINYRVGGGSRAYGKTRTQRADWFLVMDYFLGKSKLSNKIEKLFLKQYDFLKRIDDAVIAVNFLKRNKTVEAKKFIDKIISPDIFWFFSKNITKKKIKGLILIIIIFVCFNMGIGKPIGKIIYRFK